MSTNPLLKGSLQTIILKLLEDNDQMYGYEITQKVKEVSEGEIMLTEGALYPALHKLEARCKPKSNCGHPAYHICYFR